MASPPSKRPRKDVGFHNDDKADGEDAADPQVTSGCDIDEEAEAVFMAKKLSVCLPRKDSPRDRQKRRFSEDNIAGSSDEDEESRFGEPPPEKKLRYGGAKIERQSTLTQKTEDVFQMPKSKGHTQTQRDLDPRRDESGIDDDDFDEKHEHQNDSGHGDRWKVATPIPKSLIPDKHKEPGPAAATDLSSSIQQQAEPLDHYQVAVEKWLSNLAGIVPDLEQGQLARFERAGAKATDGIVNCLLHLLIPDQYHVVCSHALNITTQSKSYLPVKKMKGLPPMILPVNFKGHWAMALLLPERHTAWVCDSLGAGQDHLHEILRAFYKKLPNRAEVELQIQTTTGPRQTDKHSCGIFAIVNSLYCAFRLEGLKLNIEAARMLFCVLHRAATGDTGPFDLTKAVTRPKETIAATGVELRAIARFHDLEQHFLASDTVLSTCEWLIGVFGLLKKELISPNPLVQQQSAENEQQLKSAKILLPIISLATDAAKSLRDLQAQADSEVRIGLAEIQRLLEG